VAIHFDSNKITFVGSRCNKWRGNRFRQPIFSYVAIHIIIAMLHCISFENSYNH
jgi:hypothetical protein